VCVRVVVWVLTPWQSLLCEWVCVCCYATLATKVPFEESRGKMYFQMPQPAHRHWFMPRIRRLNMYGPQCECEWMNGWLNEWMREWTSVGVCPASWCLLPFMRPPNESPDAFILAIDTRLGPAFSHFHAPESWPYSAPKGPGYGRIIEMRKFSQIFLLASRMFR